MIHTYKIDVRCQDVGDAQRVATRGSTPAMDALCDGRLWSWGDSPTAAIDQLTVHLALPIEDGCNNWRELGRRTDRPMDADRARWSVEAALADALEIEELEVVSVEVETDE